MEKDRITFLLNDIISSTKFVKIRFNYKSLKEIDK